jgi:hypothetical protein
MRILTMYSTFVFIMFLYNIYHNIYQNIIYVFDMPLFLLLSEPFSESQFLLDVTCAAVRRLKALLLNRLNLKG